MNINYNPELELTKEDIETAIKEYVDRNIKQKLHMSSTKVVFKLKDYGIDDDRGPYCSDYQLHSAVVKAEFEM